MHVNDDQTTYEPPAVSDFGDLATLTAGASDGESLDATYIVNTPKRDLTFS